MVVDFWSPALVCMYMVLRMLNLGMALLLSKAIMIRKQDGAVFCFQTSNNTMTHWLTDESGIFWQENNSHSF